VERKEEKLNEKIEKLVILIQKKKTKVVPDEDLIKEWRAQINDWKAQIQEWRG
jgi:hypothetical protein